MRPSVLAVFPSFTDRFEGTVATMYADVLNLVTVGRGNLIDASPASAAWSPALGLPWYLLDGSGAPSPAQVAQEWQRVKGGGFDKSGWRAAAVGATMALSRESIDALTLGKLLSNEKLLAARLDDAAWDDLPAYAQLAMSSWAWAAGPEAHAPHLFAALGARNWSACATEVHLEDSHNPGLVPRNSANRVLFLACLTSTDPESIAWP